VVPAVSYDSSVAGGCTGRSPFGDSEDRGFVGGPHSDWTTCSEGPEDANAFGVGGKEERVVQEEG
jgi:hypothetical protein